MHRRPAYIYLFNVPSFSSRHFNKIKRTSRLGRLLALSLEILCHEIFSLFGLFELCSALIGAQRILLCLVLPGIICLLDSPKDNDYFWETQGSYFLVS